MSYLYVPSEFSYFSFMCFMGFDMKKIIHIFLSLVIVYATTTSSYANTSIGGWTAVDTIIAGANTTINAVKTSGGKAVKSAITIAPQAGKVGKLLLRGGAVGALALAVPQLLGDGVDWVLDPANNSIKYTIPASSGDTAVHQYKVQSADFAGNAAAACAAYVSTLAVIDGREVPAVLSVGAISDTRTNLSGDRVGYPFYCKVRGSYGSIDDIQGFMYGEKVIATKPAEERQKPIGDIADQVISNAAAGDVASQDAVKAAALEGFAAGEHDAALDAAAIPDTGVENPPVTDPANPPKDPPFDDSGIIGAINSLKALLAGILSSISSLADFFKSEPPPEPTPEETVIDIPTPDLPTPDTDINFGGSCPANFEVNSSIFGNPINIVLLDTTKFCSFLSTFVKYPVYAVSSLFALYILGGRKDV